MTNLKKISLAIGLFVSSLSFGQSVDCASMAPICTDAGLDFTAQSGVDAASVTDPTNLYGCLSSTPNPTWYYFEISQAGNIDMSLSAPSDIDFIVYGPFTDLATAQGACGTMGSGTAPIVDCSYSGTANETPSIPNTVVGEVYVMLITNYANSVQDITLAQTGGTGETDCSIVEACVSNPGTFVIKKNGVPTAIDVYLCEGDVFSIDSNDDYILPNDTVVAPIGDFGANVSDPTTAQLMFLVYNQAPQVGNMDPTSDPGFMGNSFIIPNDTINGGNTLTNPLLLGLGGNCGSYWFVPVAGDDGIGNNNNVANGTNDNGGLHWDKNGNGCYLLGDAIKVTFACPMITVPTIACGGANGNSMDIAITGGNGTYTITNQGVGNILNSSVPNTPGIATITNLVNNSGWEIHITDQSGCEADVNGTFSAPTINSINITPATSCSTTPSLDGSLSVTLNATGQAPYVVDMNANLNIAGSPYVFGNAAAGTAVTILVTDDNGCTYDQIETITGASHYIATTHVETPELCFGDETGTATITALGVDGSGAADNTNIVSIEWVNPNGVTIGSTSATHLTQNNMMSGNWLVTISDDTGCSATIAIVIGAPQELEIIVDNSHNIKCFGGNDGDITLTVNGGVGNTTYSWNPNNPVAPGTADAITANNLTIGVYEMYVTDDNGCKDSIEITLTEPAQLEAYVNQIKLNVLCYGDETGSIIIDSVLNNAGTVSYLWDLQPFYSNPPVTSNIATGLGIGTYGFKVKDLNNCERYYEVTITQNDSLYWSDFSVTEAVCRNQIPFDNGHGQLSAAVSRWAPGAGGPNITYQWTHDATGFQPSQGITTIGNLDPGFYTMVAMDDHGCILDSTIYLDSISPTAAFDATSPQFTSNYVGTAPVEVTFTNNSTDYAFANLPIPYAGDPDVDTSMTWTFSLIGDPFQTEQISPLTRIYDTEGLYEVCLVVTENMNGCTDTACINIQVYDVPSLIIPNVFTPGGDDEINNKFFFPAHVITEFECTVFNRWGDEVYKFTDITDQWDGTKFNDGSTECSDGVYFYLYTGESSNGTKYQGQGNVHLIRK